MKTLTVLAAVILLSGGAVYAQSESSGSSYSNNSLSSTTARSPQSTTAHDVTGFSNPYTGPRTNKEALQRPPNLHPNLKPRPGGIVTDTVKYGPEMWSPVAPASLGLGERYLTAPDPRADLAHESGPAAHRDSGGWKVFSIEF